MVSASYLMGSSRFPLRGRRMNIVELKAIEAAMTPGPWNSIPWMLNLQGMPMLSNSNRLGTLTARNILPEVIGSMEAQNEVAKKFNALQATFVNQKPTKETAAAQAELGGAVIASLQASDALYHKMMSL